MVKVAQIRELLDHAEQALRRRFSPGQHFYLTGLVELGFQQT